MSGLILAPDPVAEEPTLEPGTPARRWRPRMSRRYAGLYVGVTLIGIIVLAGWFLPLRHDPLEPYPSSLVSPNSDFWFGTDNLGRDVFARTIRGARLDPVIALSGTLISICIGVPIGLTVGYLKGKWSERFMRVLDIFQALPLLVLAIVLVALTGSSARNVVLAITVIYVPRFIRLIRSEVFVLRESRFIEAAVAIGASRRRILFRHLLPNVSGVILVQASLTAAQSILVIAGLSYLGIGVPPPTPTWGGMIQIGTQNIVTGQWWPVAFPGLIVFVCVASFNLISDNLDRILGRRSNG